MSENISFDGVFDFDEGEEEQEVTEPAEESENETEEVDDNTEGEEEQEVTEPAEEKQSAEDNKRFAAARRKAEKERDEAIARLNEQHAAEMEAMIASLGLENPYTGKMITTRAELDSYKQQHDEETRKEMQERTGLSDEDVEKLVEASPKYQQAMKTQVEANAAKERAEREQAQLYLDNAIKEIGKMDPSIKSMDDLRNHDSFQNVDAYVKRGYSIPDAFEKANREDIRQRERAAIEQQIRNSINGRSHLDSNTTHGDGGIAVPADMLNELRSWNTGMTDDEIRSWYAKDAARMKKKGR